MALVVRVLESNVRVVGTLVRFLVRATLFDKASPCRLRVSPGSPGVQDQRAGQGGDGCDDLG